MTWVNDRGGSGTANGTTSWTASGITLQTGVNVLTVTARDARQECYDDQPDGHLTSTVTLTVSRQGRAAEP